MLFSSVLGYVHKIFTKPNTHWKTITTCPPSRQDHLNHNYLVMAREVELEEQQEECVRRCPEVSVSYALM